MRLRAPMTFGKFLFSITSDSNTPGATMRYVETMRSLLPFETHSEIDRLPVNSIRHATVGPMVLPVDRWSVAPVFRHRPSRADV